MEKQQVTNLKKKVFMIWEEPTNGDDGGYWNHYETLEDAVSDKGDGVEVFVSEPRPIGKFKRSVEIVKIPRGKKKLKKAKR